MISVKTTFQSRANEVEVYFQFINTFIRANSNDDLNKIMKSNLLLMLYNLVESSISNAIEEIHNNIYSKTVSFDVLKIEIREVLIKYLKSYLKPMDFVKQINQIAIDIVKKSFKKEKISNGSIDSRKIKQLGDSYGFSSLTTFSQTKNGECLKVEKNRRNDLAHGTFSFTEVGKDYTLLDLEIMKNETIHYLTEILDNIDTYLLNEDYKQRVAV